MVLHLLQPLFDRPIQGLFRPTSLTLHHVRAPLSAYPQPIPGLQPSLLLLLPSSDLLSGAQPPYQALSGLFITLFHRALRPLDMGFALLHISCRACSHVTRHLPALRLGLLFCPSAHLILASDLEQTQFFLWYSPIVYSLYLMYFFYVSYYIIYLPIHSLEDQGKP